MTAGDPSLPRPEYPRPDRQRGRCLGLDWLNLNGPWQFRFDPDRRGLPENWFKAAGDDWRQQILVPFCWESLAAWGEDDAAGNDHYFSHRVFKDPVGVTAENHRYAARHEVGWYRRRIEIPSHGVWENKQVILTIGAADFFTDCWCNGVHLGHHEGGYVPCEFDLTDALTSQVSPEPRFALIVIRVEDPMENREQPVGKQWRWYTTTSGIWQTVFIEPRSLSHIDFFRVFPDIDRREVRFEIECIAALPEDLISAEITSISGTVVTLVLHLERGRATGVSRLEPMVLWEPDAPHLYSLVFRLSRPSGGKILDEVHSYFGMRKLEATLSSKSDAPGVLRFNNRPVYLRGALYQSFHPAGVYTARDSAVLRSDLQRAREVGFDFLRIHLKLEDPLLLHYADVLGLLLMQDLPNFGEGGDTELGRARFETMLRSAFRRDFNHPSVIAWCIFNETWGFGGQAQIIQAVSPRPDASPEPLREKINNRAAFPWIHAMWLLAKQLDPTRLIEDMSVVQWDHLDEFGHAETDINSWHFYQNNYDVAKAHIADVVAKTFPGSPFNYVAGFAQKNAPLINSEYGGVGALDGDRDVSWSFKFLTNELRRYRQLSAYIYTELTDVEWERNGILNYDRSPKEFGYDLTSVNSADVLPICAPPITRGRPGDVLELEVLSSHYGSRECSGVMLEWCQSAVDSWGDQHPALSSGSAKINFTSYHVERALQMKLTLPPGPSVSLLSVAAHDATGAVIATNFVQHFSTPEPLPLIEERPTQLLVRQRIWSWRNSHWTDATSSREDAERTGSCFGRGTGFFEWCFYSERLKQLKSAQGLSFLVEVSACKHGIAQTDTIKSPSDFEVQINDRSVHRGTLPDHPHDARGALSYLRGGAGAYGFRIHIRVPEALLNAVAAEAESDGLIRVRLLALPPFGGGLTVYDYDCGRYPFGPTLLVDWRHETLPQ